MGTGRGSVVGHWQCTRPRPPPENLAGATMARSTLKAAVIHGKFVELRYRDASGGEMVKRVERDGFVTVAEAAMILNDYRTTIYRLIQSRRLQSHRSRRGVRLVPLAQVLKVKA